MVRFFFIIMFGFILGALLIENKSLYSDKIALPVAFLPDGGKYDGKLRKGELNDLGIIIWPFGDRYEGEFKAGLYHGKGRLETTEFIYDGDFFEGVATGEAKIDFADGRKYEGEVEAMKANGLGMMTTATTTYRGTFNENLYHGEGLLTETSGKRYEGSFENGVFWGEGKLVEEDGSILEGSFANGLPNGKGFFRSEDVSYEGGFKNGLFHGVGTLTKEGSEYIGEFANGFFNGQGRYLNDTGLFYEGEFKRGEFSGNGILTEKDTRYEGGFLNNLKEGDGLLSFAPSLDEPQTTQTIKGVWQAGKLVRSDQPSLEFDDQKLAEQYLYEQAERLREGLQKVVVQDPEKIDLYFMGVAGDGRQDIFRRDVELVRDLFGERYGTKQRSLLLMNGRFKEDATPLATQKSIALGLETIASKMDPVNDVLFVMLSGSASKEGGFYLEQPGVDLQAISGSELGALLKKLPVKNKVIVISSCYAGSFIKFLKDNHTMVIASSAEDKESFNCGGYQQNTRFVSTFFKQYFIQFDGFEQAFESARDDISEFEKQRGYSVSDPLIFKPKAVVSIMERWRQQ